MCIEKARHRSRHKFELYYRNSLCGLIKEPHILDKRIVLLGGIARGIHHVVCHIYYYYWPRWGASWSPSHLADELQKVY
jgi:hypothetical protein